LSRSAVRDVNVEVANACPAESGVSVAHQHILRCPDHESWRGR
jgi:hypothetical protein